MLSTSCVLVEHLENRRLLSHGSGIDGIGVLGDSYGDEYQFYGPDRATARNWVEQLSQDSNVSFGKFSRTDPDGPKNAGFEYDWAVSGATSSDMIAGGQLSGLTPEVASGHVDLVSVFIGGNDFRDVFTVLATQGPAAAQAALMSAVPTVVTNIAIVAGSLTSPDIVAANPHIDLVLTTIPKLSHLPEVRRALLAVPQIQPFVDAVDGAVQIVNQHIFGIAAASDRIGVADFSGLVDEWFAGPELRVGKVVINRDELENPTNEPRGLVLADGIHPGTIGQGLLANLIVQTANDKFATHVHTLSSRDMLTNAGLRKQRNAGCKASHDSIFSQGSTGTRNVAADLFACGSGKIDW